MSPKTPEQQKERKQERKRKEKEQSEDWGNDDEPGGSAPAAFHTQ